MKTYTIIYGEEIPHYTTVRIEAASDEEAIERAKALDTFGMPSEPEFSSAVCRRIVLIGAESGETISDGIALDGWRIIELYKRRR